MTRPTRSATGRRRADSCSVELSDTTATKLRTGLQPDEVARIRAAHPLPATRGDCRSMERPCPFVSCRHHLYLDVSEAGSLKLNTRREPWEMRHTCSLDVADQGGETLEGLGEIFNLAKERVRQIEEAALDKCRAYSAALEQAATTAEEIPLMRELQATVMQAMLRSRTVELREEAGRWPTLSELADVCGVGKAAINGALSSCPAEVLCREGERMLARPLPNGVRMTVIDTYRERPRRARRARARGVAKAFGLNPKRTELLLSVVTEDDEAAAALFELRGTGT